MSQELITRIRELNADLPRDEQIFSPWEMHAQKDPRWRKLVRWARRGKAASLLGAVWLALYCAGYRVVSSSDANLAAEVRIAMPDPGRWAEAELRQRLTRRARAVEMFEAAIADQPQEMSWMARLFSTPEPGTNAQRADRLVMMADAIGKYELSQRPLLVNWLVVTAANLDKPDIVEVIQMIIAMPADLRRETVAGHGALLRQYILAARALGTAQSEKANASSEVERARSQVDQETAELVALQKVLDGQLQAVLDKLYRLPEKKRQLYNFYSRLMTGKN